MYTFDVRSDALVGRIAMIDQGNSGYTCACGFPLAFAMWLYAVILIFPLMFTGNGAYQDFGLNSSLWLLLGILYRLKLCPKAYETDQSQVLSGQA